MGATRTTKRVIAGLALALSMLHASACGAPDDLDLVLTHQSRALGADGVTRTTEFSERFSRRERLVWIERVLPAPPRGMGQDHAAMRGRAGHDHGAHLETASRWITPAPTGEAKLALVDADDAVIVDVDKAGFANFGFHGSWARARHLVDPDSLAKMRRVGSPDGAGAQWYETRTGSGTLRVLWDERRRFALEVASESADGRSRMTTRAQLVGGPAAEPWKAAAAMARKSWYDLLD